MKTRLLITFVILGLVIAVLTLLSIMPSYILADITHSSLPFVSYIIIESEQYEPVISFKKKYPDYTVIIPDQPNPENEKIIYQYHNSSLNRIETLSIVVIADFQKKVELEQRLQNAFESDKSHVSSLSQM